MARDPLDLLAWLRGTDVAAARRRLAEARAATAAQQRAASAAEAALAAEQPGDLAFTYGAFLACGLAARQAERAALLRAEAAEDAEREGLARLRAAETVVAMLRDRRAAARRRDAARRDQARLEDALPRG